MAAASSACGCDHIAFDALVAAELCALHGRRRGFTTLAMAKIFAQLCKIKLGHGIAAEPTRKGAAVGDASSTTLVIVTVFVGAMSQRLTGMGFALIASPFLVVLMGPIGGVTTVNLCSALASSLILSRVWHEVDWSRFRRLVIWAILGIVLGAWVATNVSTAVLEVVIGALVVIGLSASLLVQSHRRVQGRGAAEVAGFSSGLMTVTAGVGGPALSIFAMITGWTHRKFVATIQPYFITVSIVSVVSSFIADSKSWPQLAGGVWILMAASLIGGLIMGEWMTARVSPGAARAAMIVLAFVGGAITLVKGIYALVP